MDSNIIRQWNGKTIRQREDGCISLTDMAQACGKRLNDWARLESTNSYLAALSRVTGIPAMYQWDTKTLQTGTCLLEVKQDGTWGHRKVGIRFAQWCSDDFAIQVDTWIEEIFLKGYVAIADIPEPAPRYLPVIDQADKAVSVAERYKAVFGAINPQIEQHLKDLVGNTLVESNRALESDRRQHESWMGVVNFAQVELGYTVPKKGAYRDSALGMWIRFYYPELSDKQERRFCNETQRDIWVYPIHKVREQLTLAVNSFFMDINPSEKLRLEGAYKRNK